MKTNIIILFATILLCAVLSSCSRDEPALSGPTTPVVLPVVMNEVYSRGDTVNPDWIEIYNPNTTAMNIGGYKIYDAGGQSGAKPKKTIAAGTSLGAKAYLVIKVDTADVSGFGLSSIGETVWFENGSGVIVDSCVIPALGIDSSYARKPDGSTSWQIANPPTKGGPNSTLPICMNEVFSRGVAPDLDWIELYNPNNIAVNIGGYKIYDAGGQTGVKGKKEIPAGTILPANGFFVITVDTTDATGFGLSSAGETAWLENANGNLIDMIAFPAMPVATTSYGRNPNGSSTWAILNSITKGTSNNQ
ncbi:MAG: lamin tail domain-containing protein [Bacteroidota bacterium]